MSNKIKVIIQIMFFVFIVYVFIRTIFIQNELKTLQIRFSEILTQEQKVAEIEQRELFTVTSATMEIIAIGVALFALFGGFISVINVNQSRELSKYMKKAKQAIRNQKELSANRFLQEGQLYRSWNRPHYARESYNLAMDRGKGTFSALVAEFALISMYADILSDQLCELENVEKKFETFIEKLKKGKHYYRGRKYLRADSYFTLACIYANFTLSAVRLSEKKKYAQKASKMFELAIKEDSTNPDVYRNYAAHLSGINEIKKCKKQIKLAHECVENDILLAEFMDNKRLVDLFTLGGRRTEEESKAMLREIDVYFNGI